MRGSYHAERKLASVKIAIVFYFLHIIIKQITKTKFVNIDEARSGKVLCLFSDQK